MNSTTNIVLANVDVEIPVFRLDLLAESLHRGIVMWWILVVACGVVMVRGLWQWYRGRTTVAAGAWWIAAALLLFGVMLIRLSY